MFPTLDSCKDFTVPLRRSADRIKCLSAALAQANEDDTNYQNLALELQTALKEHATRMRAMVRHYPAINERRSGRSVDEEQSGPSYSRINEEDRP